MDPLERSVRYFTEETGILACMRVTCGTADQAFPASAGEQAPGVPLRESSLFDLASLTKLFTALLALRLRERGRLDFARPVGAYTDFFPYIQDIPVADVLCFTVPLQTPQRVDAQPNRDAGLRCLAEMRVGTPGPRAYSDMHSMVLKYVIEGAADASWWEALQTELLRPLGMRNTFALVPPERRADCVDYRGEHRLERGQYILRSDPLPGDPHDPKAHLLQTGTTDVCGHAGLFSTAADMTRLCQAILRGEVLRPESLALMAVNRTGHPLPEGGYSQYLGCQCYVRHPDQHFSEVPAHMSDSAVAWSGFTGNHLSIDPGRGIFTVQLGNRVYNRLTVLVPEAGKQKTDYGLRPDGTGLFPWPDGTVVRSSVDYVYQKDEHLHRLTAEVLKERCSLR